MQTTELKLPSPQTAEEARVALRTLANLSRKKIRTVQVRPEGEASAVSVIVPREAFDLFASGPDERRCHDRADSRRVDNRRPTC